MLKIGGNIAYDIINSPVSLLTGSSIGGQPLNSDQKVDAFMDVVPALLSFGLTETSQVIKTTEKGLDGYNDFVRKADDITITDGLPDGMVWQERAGDLFQSNKIDQQALNDWDLLRNIFNVGSATDEVISNTK